MSRVVVEMATGNDAFRLEDGSLAVDEVARLLEVAAAKVRDGWTSGPLIDVNGTAVGSYVVEEDR